jgi:hypothetical protein
MHYWAQAYFEEILFLEDKTQNWIRQQEGKEACARKACNACMQENINTLGLGFLKETLMDKNMRIDINMCLGGLDHGFVI